jgi:hypothetical protein
VCRTGNDRHSAGRSCLGAVPVAGGAASFMTTFRPEIIRPRSWFAQPCASFGRGLDVSKGFLTRRKNEDHEAPRRSVDGSNVRVPRTVAAGNCSRCLQKSWIRRSSQFELTHCRHTNQDHKLGPNQGRSSDTMDVRAARRRSVALRGSRSFSVLRNYFRVNGHGRLHGAALSNLPVRSIPASPSHVTNSGDSASPA